MNKGFIDRTKLNFLSFTSSDEPIPEIDSIKKELGRLTLSAVNNFRPKEGAPKSQRAPRKPRGLKRQVQEGEDQSIGLFDSNLLLNSDGVGGSTKGVAMFEDLLGAGEGDTMLLCVPFFVAGNGKGIFEKYRQFCENDQLVYSDYRTCGYGSKNNLQRKGANYSPGGHLQIPVIIKSNPDGPKMLHGEIDCTKALQSNRNPSLYVLFYKENTFHTTSSTHQLCKIFYTDVLRGNLQLRHVQLHGQRSSDYSTLFKGTTPTTFLANSYHLLQQLLLASLF
jgi:hypothetical protein